MILPALLTALFAVLIFGAGLQVARERSIARAAGMSQATPVCAGCHYRLGGWTSPRCPECGVDVRVSGVRTGPRPSQFLLGLVVILLSLFIVAPVMTAATSLIFATKNQRTHGRITSTERPEFHVSFAIDSEWRRFPPRARHETELTFLAFTEPSVRGAWINGRFVGSTPRREATLRFDHEDGPADELGGEVIDVAVREVLGADVDEATVAAHARAVEKLLRTAVASQSRGELDVQLLLTWADGPLRGGGGGGQAGGTGTAWPGPVLTILTVVASVWVVLRRLGRSRRRGWRRPTTDEWLHATGPDAAPTAP